MTYLNSLKNKTECITDRNNTNIQHLRNTEY